MNVELEEFAMRVDALPPLDASAAASALSIADDETYLSDRRVTSRVALKSGRSIKTWFKQWLVRCENTDAVVARALEWFGELMHPADVVASFLTRESYVVNGCLTVEFTTEQPHHWRRKLKVVRDQQAGFWCVEYNEQA